MRQRQLKRLRQIFAEDSSDEEEDADAEEADAESADSDDAKEKRTAAKKKEDLKTVGEKTEGCIAFKLRNGTGKRLQDLRSRLLMRQSSLRI